MRLFAILFFFLGLLTTADTQMQVRRELQACTDCPAGSPGNECQGNLGGICYPVNPQTGDCPLGTTSCAGVIATATACRDAGRGEIIDEDCNATYPVCVSANGGQVVGGNPGHHCAYCINSMQPNDIAQVAPDEGCDDVNRVCVDGSRQLAADVEGSTCAVCYNSIAADTDPKDIDDGCPPSAPVCVNDAGDSPALWNPGTTCVANCVDTSRFTDADEGVRCGVACLHTCLCCVIVSLLELNAETNCYFYSRRSAPGIIPFVHWKPDRLQVPVILEYDA